MSIWQEVPPGESAPASAVPARRSTHSPRAANQFESNTTITKGELPWHELARITPNEDASKPSEKIVQSSFNLGGLLGGLGGFIEKLGELAEAGEETLPIRRIQERQRKNPRRLWNQCQDRLGEGGQTELKVEPFGNVRRAAVDRPSGEDVREPLVDLHEEDDHVLVLIELPGVARENIHLSVADGRLELSAERGKTVYRKEIDLPQPCSAEHMSWESSNGILQVRFNR